MEITINLDNADCHQFYGAHIKVTFGRLAPLLCRPDQYQCEQCCIVIEPSADGEHFPYKLESQRTTVFENLSGHDIRSIGVGSGEKRKIVFVPYRSKDGRNDYQVSYPDAHGKLHIKIRRRVNHGNRVCAPIKTAALLV